ncbi:MAG TPA: glycosyltransferase family 4 protein, partial [Bryobacteraceae bacterium]|nr:glycosyltransferase family 4 protein [Bryobacteraceae bacterium]
QNISGPAKNLIRFAIRSRPAVDLHVLTYSRTPENQPPTLFQKALREAGIPFTLIRERGRFDLSILRALTTELRALDPAIIQTHAPKSHFLFSLIKHRFPARWLAYHHGYTNEDTKMRAYNALNRLSLRRADRVATVCSPFRDDLLKEGVKLNKISVLHNSIEEDWLAGSVRESRETNTPFVFLCIGRLSHEKGHAYLLEAIQSVAAATSRDFRLDLIGAGALGPALEETARSLGIANRVRFLGSHADVRPFFAEADAFVLPSLSEGSPNVLLEAMAARVPILASAVGGIPELVGDCAVLIPPADSKALASGMLQFLKEPGLGLSLAQKAFNRVSRKFTPERYVHRMFALYRLLLRPRFKWTPARQSPNERLVTR